MEIFDPLTLGREDLDAVLPPFADIDKPVFGDFQEVQVWHKLLFFWWRTDSPLVRRNRIVRDLTQRHAMTAPPALERARVHVVHEHALPIEDVDFTGGFVELKTAFRRKNVGLLIVLGEFR